MKKVLIIDDDEFTLEILGMICVNIGCEVVLKNDLLSLSEIESINPGMIFLDHWMGREKTGGELCLEIKQNEATKDIPVIMISTVNNIGNVAMDNCADGCLKKPFEIEEIESVVEAYIG
jgi:CheY-like chemotaxis protein